MLHQDSLDYKLLAETFTLTAFFRGLTKYPHSSHATNFLLKNSHIELEDLNKRWDSFDKVFGHEKGNLISALSFSTIIEARGLLLDSILEEKILSNDTLILEMGSGFSPRGLHFINDIGYKFYVESDLSKTINLKNKFNEYLNKNEIKTPLTLKFNVELKKDWMEIYNSIKILKLSNSEIKHLQIVSEGLLIYLDKKSQKHFFEELSIFVGLLKNEGISVSYLTIDMPTHENFTNWLVHEGFDFASHIDVMKNVDPQILESLHNTQKDFIMENNIGDIKKYRYNMKIISSLHTPRLDKYKDLELDEKIEKFLLQDIMFAWEIDL